METGSPNESTDSNVSYRPTLREIRDAASYYGCEVISREFLAEALAFASDNERMRFFMSQRTADGKHTELEVYESMIKRGNNARAAWRIRTPTLCGRREG